MTIYQSTSMYQQYICALYPEWPAQCCPSVLPWSLSTQSRSPGGRRPGGWGTPRERKRRSWWWGRGSADSPCWPTQRAAAAAAHYSDAWRCQPSAHLGNPSAAVEGMRRGKFDSETKGTHSTIGFLWLQTMYESPTLYLTLAAYFLCVSSFECDCVGRWR